MVLAALGAVVIFTVWLSGVGGSYALWQDSATVDAGTITTGTAGLAVAWAPAHADPAWSNLLPGESVRQGFTLTNTGSAALEMTSTASALVPGFDIRVIVDGCPNAPLTVAPLAGEAHPLAGATGPAPAVVAAGTARAGCLELRATAAATPDQHVAFIVQLGGKQVHP